MSESHSKIITNIKAELGSRLTIMGHHYQNDHVIQHCDLRGDSLELARKVPGLKSEYIVFCGVSFMAETAAMLASDQQKVILPAPEAGCVMSDMAPWALLDAVMRKLTADGRRVTPLAYVNTEAAIKSVVANYGGSVCTSANAETMLKWAREQGDGVLFLPDANLGMNTANRLGIPESKWARLDVSGMAKNLNPEDLADKEMLLWPGLCVIHKRFKAEQIDEIRHRDPDALVVVHPECHPDVVAKADADGSTSFIIKYVEEAPPGAAIYIGTEINLVERLAKQYRNEKLVRPLYPSRCLNMAKTTEEVLAATLQDLDGIDAVTVPGDVAHKATVAIERMLDICS
ncbi:quinolinate synthase NadA [Desulfovibrio ferrophilus]|uniref:Quinolinate synthase n=1 Tax=Desulfovibrio ferrophilus TaxID=241368 RepID=A0A2Z6AWX9_9BACT|nr:quinolinate synthase NadA [Desulfovibrio ferrophilus]BBD07759.1 quinolinate synthetase complex subunit A [Desulfovibrio ferrophilus]